MIDTGAPIDITGQRFGRLTAIELSGHNRHGKRLWRCRCECGREIVCVGSALKSGNTQSCGCLQREMASLANRDDLSGRTFGKLTVLSLSHVTDDGRYETVYRCECECGAIRMVHRNQLISGKVTTCGNKICQPYQPEDETGKQYGRLTVLERCEDMVTPNGRNHITWRCQCLCGNVVVVRGDNLRSGQTTSCGCKHIEQAREIGLNGDYSRTHGCSHSRLYHVWGGMKQRVLNQKYSRYKDYGGRGITICDEWKNDFAAFAEWAIAHGYDDQAAKGQCTIDRIDNDKGYSPENCRWVSMAVQATNKRPRKRKDDKTIKEERE